MMVEDGNGQSEVVALGLMTNEEKETLHWFFETFKRLNDRSTDTRLYMTDKDMVERKVIKEVFPDVNLAICLFHVLRTFNREITCEKQNINSVQRDQLKKIFEDMCYARSEDEYNSLFIRLKSEAPASVFDYFLKNWHTIKNEWVTGLTFHSGNFLNDTNNRLESFNGKLKSVIPTFSNINDFIEKLFILLRCVRLERDTKAVKMVQKLPTTRITDKDLLQYFCLLTPYAFDFVKKQFEIKSKTLSSTTVNICGCRFNVALTLPCSHIFYLRSMKNITLYKEELCAIRWTRKYYQQHQRVFQSPPTLPEIPNITNKVNLNIVTKNSKKLSSNDKFRRTSTIGSKIANLLSTLPSPHYESKIEQLTFIYNSWKEGKELFIEAIDSPGSLDIQDLQPGSSETLQAPKDDSPPLNDGASTSRSNSDGI